MFPMMMILSFLFWDGKGFDGNVSLLFTSHPFYGEISDEGQKLVIEFYSIYEFSIFHNTGYSFQLNQTIPFASTGVPTFGCTDISPDGSVISYAGSNTVLIYALQSGQYSIIQTITFAYSIHKQKLSSHKLLISTADGYVYIYEWKNNEYQQSQAINDGESSIAMVGWSQDEAFLMYVGMSGQYPSKPTIYMLQNTNHLNMNIGEINFISFSDFQE